MPPPAAPSSEKYHNNNTNISMRAAPAELVEQQSSQIAAYYDHHQRFPQLVPGHLARDTSKGNRTASQNVYTRKSMPQQTVMPASAARMGGTPNRALQRQSRQKLGSSRISPSPLFRRRLEDVSEPLRPPALVTRKDRYSGSRAEPMRLHGYSDHGPIVHDPGLRNHARKGQPSDSYIDLTRGSSSPRQRLTLPQRLEQDRTSSQPFYYANQARVPLQTYSDSAVNRQYPLGLKRKIEDAYEHSSGHQPFRPTTRLRQDENSFHGPITPSPLRRERGAFESVASPFFRQGRQRQLIGPTNPDQPRYQTARLSDNGFRMAPPPARTQPYANDQLGGLFVSDPRVRSSHFQSGYDRPAVRQPLMAPKILRRNDGLLERPDRLLVHGARENIWTPYHAPSAPMYSEHKAPTPLPSAAPSLPQTYKAFTPRSRLGGARGAHEAVVAAVPSRRSGNAALPPHQRGYGPALEGHAHESTRTTSLASRTGILTTGRRSVRR